MSALKDLYIKQFEAEIARLEEAGIPPSRAYELAGELAYRLTREELAEKADLLRKQRKEGQ